MLRILAPESNDPIINGLMSAYAVAGNDCRFIKANKVPFDALYEFRPNLVICYADQLKNGLHEATEEYNSKCVILKTEIRDNNLYGYNPKPAANLAQFLGKFNPLYKTDLCYINLTQNNLITIDHLLHFTYPNCKLLRLNIFGNPVPYNEYIGKITLKHIGHILKSSNYLLDIYNYLILDAWMNDCIAIPYRSNPLLFPEEIFDRYDEPDELIDILNNYIIYKFKNEKIRAAKEWILNGNTFYNRAIELLEILEYNKEAEECKNRILESWSTTFVHQHGTIKL